MTTDTTTSADDLSRELSTLSTASSSIHTSHEHNNDTDNNDSISRSDTTMSASSSRPTTAGRMSSVAGTGVSSRESTGIYSHASKDDIEGEESFSRENSKISQRDGTTNADLSSRESTGIYSHISKDGSNDDESFSRENSKMSRREDTMNSDKRSASSMNSFYSRENSSRVLSHQEDYYDVDDFEDDVDDSDASSGSLKQGKNNMKFKADTVSGKNIVWLIDNFS